MKTVSITTYKAFLDELKIAVEEQGWTTMRDLTTSGMREIIFKSPNDAVCGFKEYTNNSTYYNILLNYANDFDNTKSFWGQNGSVYNYPESSSVNTDRAPVLNLHNNSMNVFFFVNVNRIIVVVNALSRYVSCYNGRYLRYGTALQIPNNLFVGGSTYNDDQTTPLNSNNLKNFMYYKIASSCPSVVKNEVGDNIKLTDGTGRSIGASVFPFCQYETSNINFKSASGANCLTPAILFSGQYALGELDGVYALGSIFEITAENVLNIDGKNYKVFIDIARTTNAALFCAIEM